MTSLSLSQQILSNADIELTGDAVASLPTGTTSYTGHLSGAGRITLTSGSTGGSTLVLPDGTTFVLPDANETATATLANGAWSLDVSSALAHNQDIVLTGTTTGVIGNDAATNYTGRITGNGVLTLSNTSGYQSSLNLAGSNSFDLARGNYANNSQTLTLRNGVWTADVTTALLGNRNIGLSVPTSITLPPGTTTYTGNLSVYGVPSTTLTVTAGAGGSTLLINGKTIVLAAGGGSETFSITGSGIWTADLTAAVAANHDINLSGLNSTITLPAGTTSYTGTITGPGSIAVSSSGAGSTLHIGGQTLVLPAGGETETLTLSPAGVWSVDMTAALLANKPIALNGMNATATLPAGTTTSTSIVTGAGSLKLISANAAGGSTLVVGGHSFVLASPNETETATLSNGVWTTDVTAAVLARQAVTLTGAATLELGAGTTSGPAVIGGSGTLVISSGAGGGSTLNLGNTPAFALPSANETEVATLANGAWSVDASAPLRAGQDITLLAGTTTTVVLPAGTTSYGGTLAGTGRLAVTSAATGGSTLVVPGGPTLVLADANETATLVRGASGTWTVDVGAALAGNHAVLLGATPSVATLAPGITRYTGTLSGGGSLALTSSGTGGSTLVLKDGTTFVLPDANETETVAFANGAWSVDVTAALAANHNIVLSSGVTGTAALSGAVDYTGTISGSGVLTLTGTRASLSVNGSTYSLPGANETETFTIKNGVWSADVTQALLAHQPIVLTGQATAELGAGRYTATVTGAGTLNITSGSTGGVELVLNGATIVVPGPNQTLSATLGANGWSVDETAAFAASRNIDLGSAATVQLHAGTNHYSGQIDGGGAITVKSSATGGSTLVIDGLVAGKPVDPFTLILPDADQTETLTLSNGQWSVDYSAAIAANNNIVLQGTGTATLPAGVTKLTGSVTGAGTLQLSTGASGGTLVLADGTTFGLPDAHETETATLANGHWSVDVTQAMSNNQDIVLSPTVPLVVSLPWGSFFGANGLTYTGSITGSGSLIAYTKDSVLTLPGGYTLDLGYGDQAPLQQVTLTMRDGVWSADWSASIDAGDNVALNGASTIELQPGTVVDRSNLTGHGTVTVSTGAGGGGSWVSRFGTIALPDANQTETFTFGPNGWSTDYTSLIHANADLTLTDITGTLTLGAGTTTYKGTIDGGGSLAVSSGNAPAVLKLADGSTFVFNANQTQILTLTNGVWSTDVTPALLANQAIVLSGNATATLPAGSLTSTSSITGAGVLTLKSSATGGSSLTVDGHTFVLGSANETEVATRANGVWSTDVSAALAAGQNITLTGATTATLPAGVSTYNGVITGPGSITLTGSPSGASTLVLRGAGVSFALPAAGESEVATLSSAGVWSVDVTAAVLANQPITLTTAGTVTLPGGTTTYSGLLTGSGNLSVAATRYPATLALPGSASVVLTAADPIETVTVVNGVPSADIGGALKANQAIVLNGTSTATLASGTTTYTGAISGAGVLKLTAGGAGASTLVIGGQSFTIASAGVPETLTRSAAGDWSVDVTAAVNANQNITLTGVPTTLTLPTNGISTYRGTLSGTGTLALVTTAGTGALRIGTTTISLPSANATNILTITNGAVTSVDVTAALGANQNVNLSVNATASLPAGTTTYGGSITVANGVTLTLTSSKAGGSTVVLPDGTTFALPDAGESESFTFANNGWTANATSAVLAGHAIVLNQPTTIDLPAGTTTYTGAVTGNAPLTIVAGRAGGSTFVLGGRPFVLAAASQSETLTLSNGIWTADVTAAVRANQDITLSGPTTLTLGGGTTTYAGTLRGSGTLTIAMPPSSGGTLVLSASGTTLSLPSADTTETVTLLDGAITAVDATASLLANKAIVLGTVPTRLTLPPGTTTYAGVINGTGLLNVTSSAAGGSTLVIGQQSFVLPAAGESETLTLANGVWSVDVTAALLANKSIVLTTDATATMPAGTTTYTGTISGQGSLVVTANGAAASTLKIGSATSYVVGAGQSLRQTLLQGTWTADLTPQIQANQSLVLNGSASVVLSGNTTYTGTIGGQGKLLITSPSSGGATLKIGTTVFTIPSSHETITAALANGVWTQDLTANILANQSVTLTVPSSIALPVGVTRYAGHINGSGTLTITGANAGGSTLELAGGRTVILPGPGETETLTISNGVWTSNISTELAGNQPITLTGPSAAMLSPGTTSYTGPISGTGRLTLSASATASSTLVVNGTSIVLAAGTSQTVTLVDGVVATDVGAALAANQAVTLHGVAAALLPAGTTTYTGHLSGTGTLALIASGSGGSTLALADGTTFVLPAAGEAETFVLVNGVWTADVGEAIENNQAVVLTGAATAKLLAGAQTDTASITGTGTLTLTAADTPGGSTLSVGGHVLTLAAGQTESVTLANGVWTTDVTNALRDNQPILLAGANVAKLAAGTTTYTGGLTGAGTLTLTSGSTGPSTLVIGGQSFVLPAANDTATLTLSSTGQWSVDASAALAANQPIALSAVPTTVTLASGTTTYNGAVTGSGTLAVTSSATAPSTLILDGQTLVLPAAGETETLTRSATGAWGVDVTAALLADKAVTLGGLPATATVPANLDYTGLLSGSGTIALTSGPTGGGQIIFGTAGVVSLPSPGETSIVSVANGVPTSVDVTTALLANQNVNLSLNGTAALPAGTTTYTGRLSVNNGTTLTLTTGNGGGSLVLPNGTTFALPAAHQSEVFTLANNSWTADATAAFRAGQDIVLNQPTTVTLPAGSSTYTGTISGAASLTLVSSSSGGSTVVIGGQTVTLPTAHQSETLSFANGVMTADISAAIRANQDIVLNGKATAALAAGVTTDAGSITGTGTLVLTSANAAGGSTLVIGGQTFVLPSANESETLALAHGTWSVDVTAAITNRQDIVLNGAETVALSATSVDTNASITGAGSLLVNSSATGNNTLQLGGSIVTLSGANETVALTQRAGGGWLEDVTGLVLSNQAVALNASTPARVRLPAGTTAYTGALTGAGTLIVTGSGAGSSTIVIGGASLVVASGVTETLTIAAGTVTGIDVSAALAAGQAVTLTSGIPAVATLAAGTTDYRGVIAGSGTLVLKSGASGGTLKLPDGTTVVLPDANQTETVVMTNGVTSTIDVTAAMLANHNVTVSGASVLNLPRGTFTYTGALTGSGTLTVRSPASGSATLVIGTRTVVLPAAGESETLTIANGTITSTDITAAVVASQAVVLSGAATIAMPAGATADTSTITGAGSVTLSSGAAGGGTLTLGDGTQFVLADANETETASLLNGIWTTDITAAVAGGHAIVLSGASVAALAAGTTPIASLGGNGLLTLTAPASGASTLVTASGAALTVAAGQSTTVTVADGHIGLDVSSLLSANQTIALSTDASAFLPAGASASTGTVSGNGMLTLFGSTTGDSTVTINGTAYTIAQNGVLGLSFSQGTATVAGENTTTRRIDITAAIDADQQSIVFNGGNYVVYVPKGQTVNYDGVMSGTGTLEVAGGGTLILNNQSTFGLPADRQVETVATERPVETMYDGLDLGLYNAGVNVLHGTNAPAVIVDAGSTLDYGNPGQNGGTGGIDSVLGAYGASYNTDNVQVNGTLGVYYQGNAYGYGLSVGEIAGNGTVNTGVGTNFFNGTSSFTGTLLSYSANFGGSHASFGFPSAGTIDNTFIITFSTEVSSPTTDNEVTVPETIYAQHYGASVHDQGAGLITFTGQYLYSDSGDWSAPSLSNPLLNDMSLGGNSSYRLYYAGRLQQFGNGTNANWFLPGNAATTNLRIASGGTIGLDYNGTVAIDTTFVGTEAINFVVVGTAGNHIILTENESFNGYTQIDQNAILQLGDGTVGNSSVVTTTTAQGTVTGTYSTSSGNGSLTTAESAGGLATDSIVDNGQLIVDNTVGAIDDIGPITLSHISGTGSFLQQGTETVILLEDTTYTGETDIANGTLALGDSGGWTGIASSSGVNLLNAAAVLDVSQAGDQTIQDLSGAAGSTVAIGATTLTISESQSTLFAGRIIDGGLGGGSAGSLVKTDTGTLEMSGASTFTGTTDIEAGTLQLDGASLASSRVSVAAGALLTGSGTLAGAIVDNGTVLAEGGTLSLGPVTGTGRLGVGLDATLDLSGPSQEAVAFNGRGTLTLEAPSSYTGTISGFSPDNAIDLAHLSATGASYSATTGLLSVLNGTTTVAQLALDPATAAASFAVTSDGRGGSLVTASALAAAPSVSPAPPQALVLAMSEDAYQGDAQFSVTVNGVKQAGVYTATALHNAGQSQRFVIPGAFGDGPLNIGVTFLNDAYGGTAATDRNLYIDGVTDGGTTFAENVAILSGTRNVTVQNATTYTIGGSDTVALHLSEDAYQGDAQFTVAVDGVQQGGVRTVTALHGLGQSQEFDITGNFGAGPHAVSVTFLNDLYAGTAATDRNLYVDAIGFDGQTTIENAQQLSGGTRTYGGFGMGVLTVADSNQNIVSTGADTINAGSGTHTITLDGTRASVIGGTGTDSILAGGGVDTITANEATMTVLGGSGPLTFVGGSALGTVTGGSGSTSVVAGSGGLVFNAGSGTAAITAGTGQDLFNFFNGTGGSTVIKQFTPGQDHLSLHGYGADAVDDAINSAVVAGGSMTLTLSDHTHIMLAGVTSIDRSAFV